MSRYIDADALKKHYAWWEDDKQKLFDSIVDQQPAIDAVPVRYGRWIRTESVGWKCSRCNKLIVIYAKEDGNYCPNCGARMDAE